MRQVSNNDERDERRCKDNQFHSWSHSKSLPVSASSFAAECRVPKSAPLHRSAMAQLWIDTLRLKISFVEEQKGIYRCHNCLADRGCVITDS